MKYALLIYATPGASERPAAELSEAWLDYVRGVRDSGVLVAAEQLGAGAAVLAGRRAGAQAAPVAAPQPEVMADADV